MVLTRPATGLNIAVAAAASLFPNEPVGFTRIMEEPWSTGSIPTSRFTPTANGWLLDSTGDADNESIVSDAASPCAALDGNTQVVDCLFPSGAPGGSGVTHIYAPFAGGSQLAKMYVGIYAKLPSNWTNSGNSETKWMWMNALFVEDSEFYMSHRSSDLTFTFQQQGTVDRAMGPTTNATSANILPLLNQYVLYEYVLELNPALGTATGTLTGWVNNVLTHVYTDVNWASASGTWLSIQWNNTYGGGTDPVPFDMHFRMDHIRVSVSS